MFKEDDKKVFRVIIKIKMVKLLLRIKRPMPPEKVRKFRNPDSIPLAEFGYYRTVEGWENTDSESFLNSSRILHDVKREALKVYGRNVCGHEVSAQLIGGKSRISEALMFVITEPEIGLYNSPLAGR